MSVIGSPILGLNVRRFKDDATIPGLKTLQHSHFSYGWSSPLHRPARILGCHGIPTDHVWDYQTQVKHSNRCTSSRYAVDCTSLHADSGNRCTRRLAKCVRGSFWTQLPCHSYTILTSAVIHRAATIALERHPPDQPAIDRDRVGMQVGHWSQLLSRLRRV